MKSVMHEASSIAKAIEQAWVKAGQPQEFSVKILEEPQKNFLGFTTRSAKVALFFDYGAHFQQSPKSNGAFTPREYSREQQTKEPKPAAQRPKRSKEQLEIDQLAATTPAKNSARNHATVLPEKRHDLRHETKNTSAPTVSPAPAQNKQVHRPLEESEKAVDQAQQAPVKKDIKLLWNDATTRYTHEWLESTLESMDCSNLKVTVVASAPSMYITLRCTTPEYLSIDIHQERRVLASVSYLLMDALRQKFKTGFKHHKIVLAPDGEKVFI